MKHLEKMITWKLFNTPLMLDWVVVSFRRGKILEKWMVHIEHKSFILQVIEKAVEVGADSSQYPSNWIFHSREKKPGKAFVDGLALCLV